MPSYPQRTLTVLLLFGTLSAAMALLASSLIFQLPAGRSAPGSGPGAVRGALPESAAAVLLPVSAVLAALCLVLNVSCLLLCLLHGYFSTELYRGQLGPESDALLESIWFLTVCCTSLPALAIYMLLLFELEAGIASACILSSGIIVLLVTVTHALIRASQLSRRSRSEISHTLYENDSAQHSETPGSNLNNKSIAVPRARPEIHREFSFPPFLERKSQLGQVIPPSKPAAPLPPAAAQPWDNVNFKY
uniref:Transmembrane protein 221 n=1 Tax=Coturnix japonica TaxID=93934 RepID=A0A8C2TG09_COTJA